MQSLLSSEKFSCHAMLMVENSFPTFVNCRFIVLKTAQLRFTVEMLNTTLGSFLISLKQCQGIFYLILW